MLLHTWVSCLVLAVYAVGVGLSGGQLWQQLRSPPAHRNLGYQTLLVHLSLFLLFCSQPSCLPLPCLARPSGTCWALSCCRSLWTMAVWTLVSLCWEHCLGAPPPPIQPGPGSCNSPNLVFLLPVWLYSCSPSANRARPCGSPLARAKGCAGLCRVNCETCFLQERGL